MPLRIHFIVVAIFFSQFFSFQYASRHPESDFQILCRKDGTCSSLCGEFRCFDRLVTPSLDGSEPDKTVVFFELRLDMMFKNLAVLSIVDSFVPPKILKFDETPGFPIRSNYKKPLYTDESLSFLKPGNPYCITEVNVSETDSQRRLSDGYVPVVGTFGSACTSVYFEFNNQTNKVRNAGLPHTSNFQQCCRVRNHK